MQAIRIIHDEHRALAAVLHGLLYLVREIRDRGMKPDFELLGTMVYYIDTFPERLHHPKEDQYLFRLLRIRHPEAAPILDELSRQHQIGAGKIRELAQTLSRYERGGPSEFPGFAAAVDAFAGFHWDHMNREENEVMPLAEKHLTAGDWEAIDAAFAGHADPVLNPDVAIRYQAVFRKIAHLAPPPIGVGGTDRTR